LEASLADDLHEVVAGARVSFQATVGWRPTRELMSMRAYLSVHGHARSLSAGVSPTSGDGSGEARLSAPLTPMNTRV